MSRLCDISRHFESQKLLTDIKNSLLRPPLYVRSKQHHTPHAASRLHVPLPPHPPHLLLPLPRLTSPNNAIRRRASHARARMVHSARYTDRPFATPPCQPDTPTLFSQSCSHYSPPSTSGQGKLSTMSRLLHSRLHSSSCAGCFFSIGWTRRFRMRSVCAGGIVAFMLFSNYSSDMFCGTSISSTVQS